MAQTLIKRPELIAQDCEPRTETDTGQIAIWRQRLNDISTPPA
jgi:hypothetical protein